MGINQELLINIYQEQLTSNNKISKNYFENKLKLNKYYITDDEKKVIIKFYVKSLNILLQKILSLYNLDYDIYIKEHNYYNKYYNDCLLIINKHKKKERYEIPDFDVYIIESYEWDVKIITKFNSNFENDFNEDKHNKFLINEWNYNIMENSYDLYSELYDYLKLHLTILQEEQLKKEQLEKIKKEKIQEEQLKKEQILQEEQLKKEQLKKIKKEKIKKKAIPKPLKQKVWNRWVGIEIGQTKCLCCKLNDISQGSFSCGHIIAEINGGELKMDNLKPICVSCNSSMGIQNMNEYIIKYGF